MLDAGFSERTEMQPIRSPISPRCFSSVRSTFGLDTLSKIRAARSCVPEFQPFTDNDFYVQPLKGGLTNLLWTVGVKTDALRPRAEPNKVQKTDRATPIALVREYGRGTESFMNRAQEEQVVQALSDRELCPRVYGVFPWGRVEKFLENSRTLLTTEYASYDFLEGVAEILGRFHAQSPTLLKLCTTEGDQSCLADRMEMWYKIARKVSFESADPESRRKQRKLNALDLSGTIRSEMEWFFSEVQAIRSPVVFAHCDLQEGNLLWHNDTLHMIDFEYSERLERGFDLGNCFCEMSIDYRISAYPGFVVNPDMLPDLEKQVRFVRAYAKGASLDPSLGTTKQLLREANLFVMGSHLHWVLWSIVQAGTSTIEFGYLEYAEQRLDQYLHCKRKWADALARFETISE